MKPLEMILVLNEMLLEDMPQYKSQVCDFPKTLAAQKRLLRSLMNLRPPMPLSAEFLALQDEFLQMELREKGSVALESLIPSAANKQLYLWQGDITRLAVDAIVNAANSALLGCFVPCHACIDNAIHSAAGLQLRRDCDTLMQHQGEEERTGQAKITAAYNLPSEYVIHTVGPIVGGKLTQKDCDLLAQCYRACLQLAIEKGLGSIAFCCISTGEFHFPNDKAAEIALRTVQEVLAETNSEIKVIFNVFKQCDYDLYSRLLG